MRVSAKFLLLLASWCIVSIVFGGHAAAAPPTGITLSPFLQQVTLDSSAGAKSFTVSLTNNTKATQSITLSTQDFGSLNDTGGVLFGAGSANYSKMHGLARWLTLDRTQLDLAPGQSATATATVNDDPSLAPGGHYGAVTASVASDPTDAKNQVGLKQQLSALVLLTKQGGERYDLRLRAAKPNGSILKLPDDVQLTFHNPGNTHVVPRGTVTLRGPGGSVIARGIINSESAFILPGTDRLLYVPLSKTGRTLPLPGTYHVDVKYRYDGLAQTAQKSFAVRFINLLFWIGVIVLFSGLLFGFKSYRKNHSKSPA